MYLEKIPKNPLTTTLVKIKYDCCGRDHVLKWKDANKNFLKNQGKHICRPCMLKKDNPASKPEVREKMKQTNLERYGTTCPLNTEERTAARVEKMFTPESIAARTEKTKQTNIERYGAEHIMKTELGVERLKATMQENHGVDFPLQSEEIKAKTRATCQERYQADNPLASPEIRRKCAETTLDRYGVEFYNQLPEMKEYLRQNCTTWLADSYENPWAKGITRPEEWNEKQRETVARLMAEGTWRGGGKYSLRGIYQSDKCRKKLSIFRSSYELQAHWHLDNDPQVEWYDYEPFQVVYYDTEGKKRHYTIDFIVKYVGRDRLTAIEVKNNYARASDMTKNKHSAFVAEHGDEIDHEFWMDEKIKSFDLKVKKLLISERVTLWEDA